MTETLEMAKQSRQQQNATEGSEISVLSGQIHALHAALRLAQSCFDVNSMPDPAIQSADDVSTSLLIDRPSAFSWQLSCTQSKGEAMHRVSHAATDEFVIRCSGRSAPRMLVQVEAAALELSSVQGDGSINVFEDAQALLVVAESPE